MLRIKGGNDRKSSEIRAFLRFLCKLTIIFLVNKSDLPSCGMHPINSTHLISLQIFFHDIIVSDQEYGSIQANIFS